MPVRRATWRAASPRAAPSATSRSTRSLAAASASSACATEAGVASAERIPTTRTNSPRSGMVPSATAPASVPSDPRTICSCTFVSSRQTAPRRSSPHAAARSRSVAATRPGASNSTHPLTSAAMSASRSRRSRPDRGRNPSNDPARTGHAARRRRPPGRPTAPGSAPPARPRRTTRRRGRAPGSLTDGVPASVTSARSAPARRWSSSACRRPGALRAWIAGEARLESVSIEQPLRQPGVLGRDERDRSEHLQRPEGDVAQVADRRGDDVQHAARVGGVTRAPTPADVAGRGSRRPPCGVRASRSAGPAA